MKYSQLIKTFFSYVFFPLNITSEYIQKLGYYLRDQKKWTYKKMCLSSLCIHYSIHLIRVTILGIDELSYLLTSFLLVSAMLPNKFYVSLIEENLKISKTFNSVFAKLQIFLAFLFLFFSLIFYELSFLLSSMAYLATSSYCLWFTLEKDPPKNKRKEENVAWLEQLKKMMSSLTRAPKSV